MAGASSHGGALAAPSCWLSLLAPQHAFPPCPALTSDVKFSALQLRPGFEELAQEIKPAARGEPREGLSRWVGH